MSAYPKFRDLHLYAGLLLGIPLVVIALTGVMLNHAERLGLKPHASAKARPSPQQPSVAAMSTSVAAQAAALPQHGKSAGPPEGAAAGGQPATLAEVADPHAFTARPGGWRVYAPALEAALAAAGEVWGDVPLERVELKHEPQHGMVVKIKAAHDGRSRDREIVWSVAEQTILWRKGPPATGAEPIDWQRVVHDLHTGKLFSRTHGYWWSDAAGAALVLLGLTGGVLYAIPLFKRRQKRRGTASPVRAALPRRPAADVVRTAAGASPATVADAGPAMHDLSLS